MIDNSLLGCTWKKSVDVLKKVVLYASYVIVAILGIVIIVEGVVAIWNAEYSKMCEIISAVITFLFGLPKLFWALSLIAKLIILGVISFGAILVYSLMWCIARELTEEDWKSEIAKSIAFVFAFAFTFIALIILITLITTFSFMLFFILPFSALSALIIFMFAPDSKAFLFIGAYFNYRKRMKKYRQVNS